MREDAIDEVLKRPARHSSSDGLDDLLSGVFFLAWGALISAAEIWPSRPIRLLSVWGPFVVCLVWILFWGRVQKGLQALKVRWVYPRVGYVRIAKPSRKRQVAGATLTFLLGVVIASLAVSAKGIRGWLPITTGIVFAAACVFAWSRRGLDRFLAYAAAPLVAGALGQHFLGGNLGVGVVIAATGAVISVGGWIIISRLLRLPPVTEDPA